MPDPTRGLIVIVDDTTGVDWGAAARDHGAAVLVPVSRMTPGVRRSVEAARRAFGRERVLDTHQPFTPQILADAAHWLRGQGAERIELRADPRHWDLARVAISFNGDKMLLFDLEGVPWDTEAREHRSLTTSTLLLIAADAVFPSATQPLGPFEQLLADEVGWDDTRPIVGTRVLAGWERRVMMLCGAVRAAMTAVLATPHVAMIQASARIMTAVPHVGLKDGKMLEEWDSDNVINIAGRIVEQAKNRGGRGPQRIVIVVREKPGFVEDALSRAAWLLDEARVEIVNVDPILGLLERDVSLLWDEDDAAAHASNLAAIMAEREDTEPL